MGEKIKKPISYSVEAKPHTPVYRMHRYFARRSYSVFRELISYYTNEGDIILDPFCGGGVTVVEGLRLKRKVIGVDLNPMATFITKVESMAVDLVKLKESFNDISQRVSDKIQQFYETHCPKCKALIPFDWIEWSHIYECPSCKKEVIIFSCNKKNSGRYECNLCRKDFVVTNTKKVGEEITRISLKCKSCGYKGIKEPDKFDIAKDRSIKENFSNYSKSNKLWYPLEEMPMEYDLRRPYNYQMKKFVDFLTKRNLLSLSILFNEINKTKNDNLRYIMFNVFTSTLSWVTKLCVEPGHGWPISAYWVADTHYELNVWKQFNKRFEWFLRGKEYSNKEIGTYYKETNLFHKLEDNATAFILTKSSAKLPIPNNSVDAVITDPPYGWNVKYSELSNFSIIWLKELFGINKLMDNREEAIISEYQNKNASAYEELLYKVFKECYRVLKPNKWMVMTFNNKESSVWIALLKAAQRAGFYLPEDGIIYQEPIKHYTNTLYQRREGSVLGDFVYSFQKKTAFSCSPKQLTNGEAKEMIYKVALEIINDNGGATTSEIYQHTVPQIFNNYIITDEKEIIPDVEQVLQEKFEHKTDNNKRKWIKTS